MNPKPFYFSKTVWLNVITTLIGVLAILPDTLPAEYAKYVVIATGALNVILRVWFTEQPIAR